MKSSKKQPPTFIDLFAGCGGLSLGLMQAGWKGLFAVEKNKDAFQTLRTNLIDCESGPKFMWPKWLPISSYSIDTVLKKDALRTLVGSVDMVVGGPPCQGFSSAGRRDPSDPRNKLVKSYLKFVGIVQPKIVLIENVKGITQDFYDSSKPEGKVNYSEWIIEELSREYVVTSRMLDTSAFGVPQKRQRFFIIAIRRDIADRLTESPFEVLEQNRLEFLYMKGIHSVPVPSRSAISDLEVSRNSTQSSRDSKGFEEIAYGRPLTSYQKLMNQGLKVPMPDTRLARHSPEISARFKKIIDICHQSGRLNISLSSELKASFGLKKCAIRVLDPDAPSPTITSMPDDLIHYKEPRALTVRENARLQSFPDWFAFQGKYTTGGLRRKMEVPRFTQVANAVPPLIAEALGITLAGIVTTISMTKKPASTLRAVPRSTPESLAAHV